MNTCVINWEWQIAMSSTDVFSSADDQIIPELINTLVAQLDEDQKEPCRQWCSLFFRQFASEDFDGRPIAEVVALLGWIWRQLLQRESYPNVLVFNPQHQSHGFTSAHTLLLVHQQDMPFLVDSIRMELTAQ